MSLPVGPSVADDIERIVTTTVKLAEQQSAALLVYAIALETGRMDAGTAVAMAAALRGDS